MYSQRVSSSRIFSSFFFNRHHWWCIQCSVVDHRLTWKSILLAKEERNKQHLPLALFPQNSTVPTQKRRHRRYRSALPFAWEVHHPCYHNFLVVCSNSIYIFCSARAHVFFQARWDATITFGIHTTHENPQRNNGEGISLDLESNVVLKAPIHSCLKELTC